MPVKLLAHLTAASPTPVPMFNPLDSGGTVDDHMQFVYTWIFWTSVVVGVFVTALLLYAFVKFRRRSDDEEPEQVHGSTKLEWTWTITPYLILMVLFVISALNMEYVREVPGTTTADAVKDPSGHATQPMNITVIGQQFSWTYDYDRQTKKSGGDVRAATTLVVPAYTPIQLWIVSSDVAHPSPNNDGTSIPTTCSTDPNGSDAPSARLKADMQKLAASGTPEPQLLGQAISDQGCGVNHSFFIPALAGQMNAIPGQLNQLWFEANPGDYLGQCTELCGVGHANMLIEVQALSPSDWAQWLNQQVNK